MHIYFQNSTRVSTQAWMRPERLDWVQTGFNGFRQAWMSSDRLECVQRGLNELWEVWRGLTESRQAWMCPVRLECVQWGFNVSSEIWMSSERFEWVQRGLNESMCWSHTATRIAKSNDKRWSLEQFLPGQVAFVNVQHWYVQVPPADRLMVKVRPSFF